MLRVAHMSEAVRFKFGQKYTAKYLVVQLHVTNVNFCVYGGPLFPIRISQKSVTYHAESTLNIKHTFGQKKNLLARFSQKIVINWS